MSRTIRVVDPATEEVVAQVPEDGPLEVGEKARRARSAQPGWADRPFAERAEALRRFRSLLVTNRDRLAAVLTSEMGKPITQSRNELSAVVGRIDFFLDRTGETIGDEVVHREGLMEERISHEPLGVIANVSAWNYPYFVGSNVFVPALLTGNAVLYKPSEHATLTGMEIARLLHESGVPEDVFVPVLGAGSAGAALLDSPIDGVFFTGSHATGAKVAEAAARRLLRAQLELGGKDPVYVADDVDVDVAAASVADGAFYNAGQSCCAVERVYVHERVYGPFVERFLGTVEEFAVGDPKEEATYLGPVAREAQLAVLAAQVADAKAKGAEIRLGGARLPRKGWFFAPTVVTGVDGSMTLMRDETFGPLIGIQSVADDHEATRRMAETEYGLTAGVYSRDPERARVILSRLRTGSAYWNCCDRVSPRLPWSGRGHSGMGSTLGVAGILAFVQPKAWHLRRPA